MRTRPDVITTTHIGTTKIRRDEAGYLIDPDEWDAEVASHIGAEESIKLTPEILEIIRYMREYLEDHHVAPDARFVFAFIAEKNGLSKTQARRHFFTLFPYGYVKQACKIAGFRQPRAWSTG